MLLTFEESAAKAAANVRSLGFDLDELQRDGLLAAERAELDRIGLRERHQAAHTEADEVAMGKRRWADAVPSEGADR